MKHFKLKQLFIVFVCLFFVADTILTFQQFSGSQLEGDLAAIVAPTEAYKKVLTDPFGFSAVINLESYAAPNRFFVHWPMYQYFHIVPNALQYIGASPIDSIYISCAILKMLVHLLYFVLLVLFVSMFAQTNRVLLFSTVLLIVPLLQTCAYDRQMGLVDHSITYVFFYGLTVSALLLYFYPFVKYITNHKRHKHPIFTCIVLSVASVILPFSGALIAGIALVVILIVVWNRIKIIQTLKNRNVKYCLSVFFEIPFELLIPLFILGVASLYSLYVGSLNSENAWENIPISERYLRLPIGFYQILIKRVGFPILIVLSFVNTFYIRKYADFDKRALTTRLLRNLSFFSLVYLLLLPLGGYRNYREYIIRVDTFIPVTICVLFYYTFTAILVLQIAKRRGLIIFASLFFINAVFFTLIDCRLNKANECEKAALQTIAAANESCISLDCDCNVLSWVFLTDCQFSDSNAKMLEYWHVTKTNILYKHQYLNQ